MFYQSTEASVIKEGKWDEKSCFVRQGGYDIDVTNLPTGTEYLPKGAPVSIDTSTGKVALIKTAVAQANAAKDATSLKVLKGHSLIVGDKVAGSTISAIDTSATGYDTLTIDALGAKVDADTVVDNGETCIGLVYATVALKGSPTCSVTVQAYEIEEDTLPFPLSNSIKTALTSRHAFKIQ